MKRGPATKGDHGAPFKVKSAFRCVDTRGAGHVLIDNFDHAAGCIHGVKRQPVADMDGKSGVRGGRIKGHGPTSKSRRVEPSKRQIGVGHVASVPPRA